MKANLSIEAIGDNTDQEFFRGLTNSLSPGLGDVTFGKPPKSYWVAEITGSDPVYKYARAFLKGKKDYTKANSVGSRGVFINYLLESGHLYEIKAQVSWKSNDRYFCMVSDAGEITKLTPEEADQWLKEHLE